MTSTFSEETHVRRVGPGRFEAHVDHSWWVLRGPHGGYLSGIILRALSMEVEPERAIRSFTTHFVAPPKEGRLHIATTVERRGRSMTYLSARIEQEGSTLALALAAFSEPRVAFEFDDSPMPEVASPDEAFRVPAEGSGIPKFLGKFDMRWAFGGPPFSGSPEAVVGGWIRLDPPEIADAPMVACLLDAYPPAIFPRATEPVVCPTIDLSMHFRSPLPLEGARPDDYYLGHFSSRLLRQGFFEEDGLIWSKDGSLIAQSRQLAIALPVPK